MVLLNKNHRRHFLNTWTLSLAGESSDVLTVAGGAGIIVPKRCMTNHHLSNDDNLDIFRRLAVRVSIAPVSQLHVWMGSSSVVPMQE